MRTRIRKILPAVSVLSLVLLVGCMTPGPLGSNGLPSDRYIVGAGYDIEYKAAANGTAYWVEKTSGTIIESKSAAEGDMIRFGASPGETENVLGLEMKDTKFTLYFVPSKRDKN